MKELNDEEMQQVFGGFIYEGGDGHKINGVNIKCPVCGVESKTLIRIIGETSGTTVCFMCRHCKNTFSYTYSNGKVMSKKL